MTTPIKFEQGIYKGEIIPPSPIKNPDDGLWYEFLELRKPKADELYLGNRNRRLLYKAVSTADYFESWIAAPIPRATKDQLVEIGMKERDDRPMITNKSDTVWCGLNMPTAYEFLIGHYRWHLVDAVPEPKPCPSCERLRKLCYDKDREVDRLIAENRGMNSIIKNYKEDCELEPDIALARKDKLIEDLWELQQYSNGIPLEIFMNIQERCEKEGVI